MTDQLPSDLVRQVTHTQFAPVARLMGYTVQGLKELIEQARVTSEWSTIGITRRRITSDGEVVPSMRVNCRVVNGRRELNHRNQVVIRGKVEFSIGNDAYELSGDAKAAREMRRSIAEGVVKVGQLRRGPLNYSPANSQASGPPNQSTGDDQGEQAPQAMIITPVAPRGPTHW